MTKRRVRISYGRTCQSAPYESIRLDVSIEKDVLDDQTVIAAVDTSVESLKKYVKDKIAEVLKNE